MNNAPTHSGEGTACLVEDRALFFQSPHPPGIAYYLQIVVLVWNHWSGRTQPSTAADTAWAVSQMANRPRLVWLTRDSWKQGVLELHAHNSPEAEDQKRAGSRGHAL